MRITLNKSEARALNRLRGLPERAHFLLMCAQATETGMALDGTKAAFDELVDFLIEELDEGMAPVGDRAVLASIAGRIDPKCLRGLGF